MSIEVLKDIVEAEKKIDEIVAKAEKRAEQMIKAAESSSIEAIAKKKEQIEEIRIEKIEILKKTV